MRSYLNDNYKTKTEYDCLTEFCNFCIMQFTEELFVFYFYNQCKRYTHYGKQNHVSVHLCSET